jgi:hypothetical protein
MECQRFFCVLLLSSFRVIRVFRGWTLLLVLCLCGELCFADPPVASYVFPAGGQRGKVVRVRVGGLFLHRECGWEWLGSGVQASKTVRRQPTRWFEGPMLPLPASQQAEDYPQDMLGEVQVAADAPLGVRRGRLWTSEGAAGGLAFVVGDLPEIVEDEIDGDALPVEVSLPVTINGRIFPREDIDVWVVNVRKGQTVTAEVMAAGLGSPLEPLLEVRGPDGKRIAEREGPAVGADARLRFTAPADGKYRVSISDANRRGGQAYVYRLTLTTEGWVDHLYPLGGRRGSKTRFSLAGAGVPAQPVEVALPAGGGTWTHRFTLGGKPANPVRIDLDDLPERLEREPNDTPEQAARITPPAVLNGRIDRPGDVDCWSFSARKGQTLELAVRARVLGSPLQAVLEVVDSAGKVLRKAQAAANQADPLLSFTAPADGTYTVRLRDRFRSRGGPAFAYRLRLAPPQPDFALTFPTGALSLHRGGQAPLRVAVERRGGFNGPVELACTGLPAGVKVAGTSVPPGQGLANLVFAADNTAAIGPARLTIRGTAGKGTEAVSRPAVLAPDPSCETLLLGVGLKAPFKVAGSYDLRLAPRGTVFRKRFKVERNGYTGPLEIRLADRQARHLQGVTGPVLTIPGTVSEFDYPVTLPSWMETGRTSRACIVAVGVLREGGVEHTISYTSPAQNDQIIAVVETGRLGLELGSASVAVQPGGSVRLPVSVRRGKGLQGAVAVELVVPGHVRGVSKALVQIPAGQSATSLLIRFARDALGPFNQPVVVRATLSTSAGPVTAEAKLELVPGSGDK